LLGLFLSRAEQLRQAVRQVDLIGPRPRATNLREFLNLLFEAPVQTLERHISSQQNRRRQPALLLEHSREQMFHVHLLIAVVDGCGLRLPNRLLRFFC
jgi:hypothetical protein